MAKVQKAVNLSELIDDNIMDVILANKANFPDFLDAIKKDAAANFDKLFGDLPENADEEDYKGYLDMIKEPYMLGFLNGVICVSNINFKLESIRKTVNSIKFTPPTGGMKS